MRVLAVDAFLVSWDTNTGGRMQSTFDVFNKAVKEGLNKIRGLPGAEMYQTKSPEVEVCAVQDLDTHLLICDWETDAIEASHRRSMGRFDTFDVIMVAGDADISPFDPRLYNLVVLSKMAYYSNKPYFSCGSAAIVDIYSICSKGRNYDIQGAGKLGYLRGLPRWSGRTAYVDGETGDLYQYDRRKKGWAAVANCGLHLLSKSRAVSKQFHVTETFAKSVQQRTNKTAIEVDSVILPDRDILTNIDAKFGKH